MAAPPPSDPTTAYQAATGRTRAQILAYAASVWVAMGSYRDPDIDRFVAAVVPTVLAGQLAIANLVSVHLAAVATRHGYPTSPTPVDAKVVQNGRGVPAAQVYRRPAAEMYKALAKGASFDVARDRGKVRLESLVATDLQMAKVRQANASLTEPKTLDFAVNARSQVDARPLPQPGVLNVRINPPSPQAETAVAAPNAPARRKGPLFFRRVLRGDYNCAKCVITSTRRYRVGNLLPIHPGCIPAGSMVSVPSGHGTTPGAFAWGEVQALTRREFRGELVEFVTARGDQVRVTPNHPVLTEQGWLPADLLREGHAVFGCRDSHRAVAGGPQVDQRPALIEDVFDAARMAFPLVRVPLAAEDFHADAAEGEVDVVYTHGRFPAEGDTELVEVARELGLVAAHRRGESFDGRGAFGAFVPGGAASSGGGVSGGGLHLPFLGTHLGGPQYSGSAASARFDAPPEKFSLENSAIYAERGLDLQRRLSGRIQGDRIIELRRVGGTNHVYNLHTREGWYETNNHIVSNCDCDVEPVNEYDPPLVLDLDLLRQTHEQVEQFANMENASAKGYQNIIVTHEHGEIGPVLSWRNQKFTGPADIR